MNDPIQQQLIAARRNQILDAAASVFARKGFHAATIRDIAGEAGIADGTIYNYFTNKPALLIGIFERMKAAIQQEAGGSAPMPGDFRGFLAGFLRHPLMALRPNDFALFRVVLAEMMVNAEIRTLYRQQILEPTLALAEQELQGWAARGAIQPEDVPLAVRLISSLVLGLAVQAIMGDALLEAGWDELPDRLADRILCLLGHNQG